MSVSLCGIELSNCLMNASGCWCRTEEELDDLNISQSGAIVSKVVLCIIVRVMITQDITIMN